MTLKMYVKGKTHHLIHTCLARDHLCQKEANFNFSLMEKQLINSLVEDCSISIVELTHWKYSSLALSHWYIKVGTYIQMDIYSTHIHMQVKKTGQGDSIILWIIIEVIMMPTFLSIAALQDVKATIYHAVSDTKIGIITTLGFEWTSVQRCNVFYKFFSRNHWIPPGTALITNDIGQDIRR